MADCRIVELSIKGSYLIHNFYVGDNRGWFAKTFEKEFLKESHMDFNVDETFLSKSQKNVIRGLHFQTHNPQAKLVTVISGKVWDVIVDLRQDSPTFKKWISVELSDTDHNSILIPRGFAHGFASLEDNTIMLYQCEGDYNKQTDTGIRFDDPDIGIEWPINLSEAIHSKRDLSFGSLADYLHNPMEL